MPSNVAAFAKAIYRVCETGRIVTDSMNYGRASEALRLYRFAMQAFIAETLSRQGGDRGDWFRNLVLAKLPGHLREDLERHMPSEDTHVGGGVALPPEQVLEERHYPHIVKKNWDVFRVRLRDYDEVMSLLRQLRKDRNEKIAHSSRPLSDVEASEIISSCKSVVELFDSSSSSQLAELLAPSEFSSPSEGESSAIDDGTGIADQNDVWTSVEQIERQRQDSWKRVEQRIDHFLWAGEAMEQAEELERTLNTLGTDAEVDSDEIFAELHVIRFDQILRELVSEAMSFVELDMTEAGTLGGRVSYSLPGSKLSELVIEYELRE